ncbi:hypothetical protein CDAR_36491 [Caerostris darwini]|uniref:Uncharacterized protein n=1 Tax=Caerostris darwini TaxID=1538125 RepID=A0AAV4M9W3_9ARAC|nr:hypothetical protein CDAR_36491 [Caerostris darwini]
MSKMFVQRQHFQPTSRPHSSDRGTISKANLAHYRGTQTQASDDIKSFLTNSAKIYDAITQFSSENRAPITHICSVGLFGFMSRRRGFHKDVI